MQNQYKVETIMGDFYIVADKWSVARERVLFWQGTRIIDSFLIAELKVPGNPGANVHIEVRS